MRASALEVNVEGAQRAYLLGVATGLRAAAAPDEPAAALTAIDLSSTCAVLGPLPELALPGQSLVSIENQ